MRSSGKLNFLQNYLKLLLQQFSIGLFKLQLFQKIEQRFVTLACSPKMNTISTC